MGRVYCVTGAGLGLAVWSHLSFKQPLRDKLLPVQRCGFPGLDRWVMCPKSRSPLSGSHSTACTCSGHKVRQGGATCTERASGDVVATERSTQPDSTAVFQPLQPGRAAKVQTHGGAQPCLPAGSNPNSIWAPGLPVQEHAGPAVGTKSETAIRLHGVLSSQRRGG